MTHTFKIEKIFQNSNACTQLNCMCSLRSNHKPQEGVLREIQQSESFFTLKKTVPVFFKSSKDFEPCQLTLALPCQFPKKN